MMLTVLRVRTFAAGHDARGIVLPLTLFIVLLLAAMAAALLSMGAMESQISANLLRGTQAFDLAEAGAERAVASFVANPALVGNAAAAVTALFTNQTLGSVGTYTVTYQLMGPSRVLVKSTGQSAIGNLTQQVQLVVAVTSQSPFAIVADDTQIKDAARITGTGGQAHGNSNMKLSTDGWVEQTATSTNTSPSSCTLCTNTHNVGNVGGSGPGKPLQTLSTVSPLDYKAKADFLMGTDGKIRNQAGTVLADCGTAPTPGCTTGPFAGWMTNNNSTEPGNWHYKGIGPNPPDGMYYSDWELSIDSSPGTVAAPWKATLITGNATRPGELEFGMKPGSAPYIVPYYQGLLGVGGATIIQGGGVYEGTIISTTLPRPGVFIRNPLVMKGSARLNGQILSDGQVLISQNARIDYNPAGGGLFGPPQILSWTRLAQ